MDTQVYMHEDAWVHTHVPYILYRGQRHNQDPHVDVTNDFPSRPYSREAYYVNRKIQSRLMQITETMVNPSQNKTLQTQTLTPHLSLPLPDLSAREVVARPGATARCLAYSSARAVIDPCAHVELGRPRRRMGRWSVVRLLDTSEGVSAIRLDGPAPGPSSPGTSPSQWGSSRLSLASPFGWVLQWCRVVHLLGGLCTPARGANHQDRRQRVDPKIYILCHAQLGVDIHQVTPGNNYTFSFINHVVRTIRDFETLKRPSRYLFAPLGKGS
jgi:hypothetical protein